MTWTQEKIDQFRADWDAGYTLAELAVIYKVSTTTISTYSARFGFPARSGRVQRVVDDSPRVLTHGAWVPDARGVMHWEASSTPPPPKVNPQKGVPKPHRSVVIDDAELVRLWEAGATVRELCQRYDCSEETLRGRAYRLGCAHRTPGRKSA